MAGEVSAAVRWFESVGSTQDEGHRLAAEGAQHGTAVAARTQTDGRGMRGRSWDSGDGGLWLSVVVRPPATTALELTPIRVGLALAALLETLPGMRERILLKWPNDLYIRDRKLGGVLAEGRWQGDSLHWVVVGIGLNVRNPITTRIGGAAIGLCDVGANTQLDELAEPVAATVAAAALIPGHLGTSELADFAGRDWLRGHLVSAPVAGRAEGISPVGRLLIRRADGRLVETIESVTITGAGQ